MLLLLFIPVGHRALKSNPFTLYLAGSEHSPCLTYCLLSVLLFFWRKAQQLIYVKTKVMLTCYSLFPCQLQSSSIMPRYREDVVLWADADPSVRGRCASLSFSFLMQKHFVIWKNSSVLYRLLTARHLWFSSNLSEACRLHMKMTPASPDDFLYVSSGQFATEIWSWPISSLK